MYLNLILISSPLKKEESFLVFQSPWHCGVMTYFLGFQARFLSTSSLYKSPVEFMDVKISSSVSLKSQLPFLSCLKSASG